MQDVKLIGRYEASSLAGFFAFNKGMMMARSHMPGHCALVNDWLKMASNSVIPRGPRAFRNDGGISSGPAAPLVRVACIACSNSCMVKLRQELGAGPAFRERNNFLSFLFTARSLIENLRRLTDA